MRIILFLYIYYYLIEDQIYIRINYINKFDLITIYSIAQTEVLICQNIQNSFTATELVLYKSEKMLSKLDIQFYISIPSRKSIKQK